MNIKALYSLQELEGKVRAIDTELNKIINESNLERLKEEHGRLKIIFNENEKTIKHNFSILNIKKDEMENVEESLKTLENIKYSEDINTVEKLESVDKEIKEIQDKLSIIEDTSIKLIEEAENKEKELSEIKKKMTFLKNKYVASKSSSEEKLNILYEEKNKLKDQINNLYKEIDKEAIELFQKIQKVHKDPLSHVHHRICSGCKIEIGALDYEKVKAAQELVRCQNCGRLLMYIEAPIETKKK